MTESRASTRTTAKANRPTLHARKLAAKEQQQAAGEHAITKTMLSAVTLDRSERHTMIERLAYQYAESRGFAPGHEVDDWLAAETAIDSKLMGESRAY